MTHQDSYPESVKRIDSYAESLERFGHDPIVGAALVQVRKALLARSGELPNEAVGSLLTGIKRTSPRAKDLAEGLRATMRAVTPGKAFEALSRFAELLDTVEREHETDLATQTALREAAVDLALRWNGQYPAVVFSLWSAAVRSASGPAADEHSFEAWCEGGVTFVEALYKVDILAAFSVWSQVMEWSRREDIGLLVTSKAWINLLRGAYLLIGNAGDDHDQINGIAWNFIANADALRGDQALGPTARRTSLSAALDLAHAVQRQPARTSRRKELLTSLQELKYVVVREDHLVPDFKAIDADASVVADIHAFDEPIAGIMQRADGWLSSASSWPPDMDLSSLVATAQRLVNSTGIVSPSIRAFAKRFFDVNGEILRRGIADAGTRLTIASGQAEWIAPPLVPLSWREVTDAEEMRAWLSPFASQRGLRSERTIERLRVADARFYSRSKFIEAQLRYSDSIRGILFGLLLPTKQVAVFDGDAQVIHALNGAGYLTGMDEPDTVFEYLLFFCGAVWGEDGPFSIVRRLEEVPHWSNLAPETIATIRDTLVERPEITEDVDGSWRAQATVVYADSLFKVVFHIKREGMVEMLADSPALKGLPTFAFTMADHTRVLRA